MSFIHPKIDHPLIHFATMPDEALAQVKDSELQDYSDKYDLFRNDHKTDLETAKGLAGSLEDNVKILFGSYSKQHKYLERACRSSEDLVSMNAKQTPSYDEVEGAVANAKRKIDVASLHEVHTSGGVDDITMNQQNEAIGFLLANEYTFGVDFNAHNAYDIAVSLRFDKALSEGEELEYETNGSFLLCDGCETKKISITPKQYMDDKEVSCGCGCMDYKAELKFAPNGAVKVAISGGV